MQFKHTPDQARKLLVEALRSGKYKQGRSYLRWRNTRDGDWLHCCLGVACELFLQHEPEAGLVRYSNLDLSVAEASSYYAAPAKPGSGSESCCSFSLPAIVQGWLGFVSDSGDFEDFDESYASSCLAGCNDSGVSFDEIAKMIENPPPGLLAG